MKKSLVAIFSTVCLTGAMMVTAIAAPENVSASYATKALENAVNNGLLQGTNDSGDLNPLGNLTRAEMAAVINRAFNATETSSITKFTDVENTAWYYKDMAKAVRMGTFVGEGATLAPERTISREEAFAVVARAFKLQGQNNLNSTSYLDANQVSGWAKGQVYAMINNGYVTGDGVSIDPQAPITRQDFAVIFDRMVNQYIKAQGTVTSITGKNVMVNVSSVTLKDVTIEGNLIIGDGVGSGVVTLDNVKVNGRILVRGGGSLIIQGKSVIGRMDFAIPLGNNNIFVDVKEGAVPGKINIIENSAAVKFNGVNLEEITTPEGTPDTTTNSNARSTGTAVLGTGGGSSSGSSSSNNNNNNATTAITGAFINSTTATPVVGKVLTATVAPTGAAATYQWYVGGVATTTGASYTVKIGDIGKTIYAVATGTGNYSGTATTQTTAPAELVSVIATINNNEVQVTGNTLTREANGDTLNYVTIDFGTPVEIQDVAAYVTVKDTALGTVLKTGKIEKVAGSDTKIRITMENALTQTAWRKGTYEISLVAGVVKDASGSANGAYTFTLVLN